MSDINASRLHHQIVAYASGLSALLVVVIVGVSVSQGTGYQDFESILRYRDITLYNQELAQALPVLGTIYPLDTLYIFGYVIMVFSMVQVAQDRRVLGILAMSLVIGVAILDFVENNHILAMARNAALGYPAAIGQVTFETVITQTKFNLGLALTLVISFLIPVGTRAGAGGRWLARGLVLGAPVALLTPVTTLLYISMNVVLGVLIAIVYARIAGAAPDPAHAG